MPCNKDGLLSQLKDLVSQIDDGGNTASCEPTPPCVPCETPFAQVCFTCPPCIPLPTTPCPVKPLKMPCPKQPPTAEELIAAERGHLNNRYDNFYNNYNVDYHTQASNGNSKACDEARCKKPHCEDYMNEQKNGLEKKCKGCPTGFKPCSMKLQPPACCNPIGVWKAQIQPCPPKPKPAVRKTGSTAEECTRPCCKHWKPKQGPCIYDDPCKAHCYDHPIGMKPSGRYP